MATQSASTTTLEAVDEKVKEEQIPAVAETDDAPKSVTDTVENQSEDKQQSSANGLEKVEGEKAQIVPKSLVEVTEKTKKFEEALPNNLSDEEGDEAPKAVDTPQLIVEEKPLQQSVISEELEDVCKEIKKELEVNALKQPDLSVQPDLVSADKVETDSESSGVREQVEVQNTDAAEIKYQEQSGITKQAEPQAAIQEVKKLELVIPEVEAKPESGLPDSTLEEPEKMEIVIATEAAVKCEEHPQVDEQVETVSKDVEKNEPVAPQVQVHVQQEEQSAEAEQLAPIASFEVDKKPEEEDEQVETVSKDDKKEPVAPQVDVHVQQEQQSAEAEQLAPIASEVDKKPEEEDEQVETVSKDVEKNEPVAPQVEVHVLQEEQSALAEQLAPIASFEVDKKPEEKDEQVETVSKDVDKKEPVAPQVDVHVQQEQQSDEAEQLAPIAFEVDKKPEEEDEQVETVSKDVDKNEPVAPQVEVHVQQEKQSVEAEQPVPIASSEVDKKPEEDEQVETVSKDVDKKEPVPPQVEVHVQQGEQSAEAEQLAPIASSEVDKKPVEEDEQVETVSKDVDKKEPVASQLEVHVQQEEQSAEAEKLAPIASSEVDKKSEEESEFSEKIVDTETFDPKVSMGVESARDTGSVLYAESSKEETTSQEEADTIKSSEQVVPTNDQIKANTEDGYPKEKINADEDKPELKDVGVVDVPLKEAGLDVGKPAAENKVMTTKLKGENEEEIVTTERSATKVKDDGVASVEISKDISIVEGITTDDQQVQASKKSGLEENINISADGTEKEKNDKNGKADVEKDGVEVIQELAKEVVVKSTQKQSNNIISKVKQSLVKAKKAIIGKSPNSKTQSENKVK